MEASVQLGDAVNRKREGRRSLEVGLVIIAVDNGLVRIGDEIAVGIGSKGIGDGLAVHGKGGGVKHVQGAVFNGGDGCVNCLLSAGGAGGAQRGNHNAAFSVAVAVIGFKLAALHGGADDLLIGNLPVILGRGQRHIGGDGEHIHVVAHGIDIGVALVVGGLHGGGGAGGVGVLADDDAAAADQRVGGLALGLDVKPRVGEGHVHVGVGHDGADAQEEGGVAGNHLGKGIRADVADVRIGDRAGVHQLLELHAGHDAGDIAGLIDVVKVVGKVGHASGSGVGAGGVGKVDVGIFRCGLHEIRLVAEGVCKDDVAALLRQVDRGVVALLVFGNGIFEDQVFTGNTQRFAGCLDALHVGEGVALVFVADQNRADLEIAGGGVAAGSRTLGSARVAGSAGIAAGGQAHHHDGRQQQCKKLLHSVILLILFENQSVDGFPQIISYRVDL
ncbi:hypothetical protein SDC9_67612 [bioreactor metagenome]|uniref:Uncharacterized protein n=1 Tax=bioreactor metagenome TaxID=1076179 RepID=A0A644XYJ4_9ZZZZ